MSFLRDFGSFSFGFRKKDILEYPHDVVIEVKHDDYTTFQPYERQDCLILYGLPEYSRYEILLLKATINRGVEVDFSLCRFFNEKDALDCFLSMKDKLPYLVNKKPELINPNSLKEIVTYIRSYPKQSLVHICAYFGYLDLLKSLISSDPSLVNIQDADSRIAPIHLAIKKCRLPVIQYLISNNADLTLTDVNKWNVFHYAATTNKEIIQALCQPSDSGSIPSPTAKSFPSSSSQSPISTPSNSQKSMVIKLLNSRNLEKSPPLYLACVEDKPDCIKELLKHGADGNGATLEPEGLPEHAPDQSFEHVLDHLDIKVMKNGGSALHWAKSQQCLETLLDLGLNINGKNFQGETVVHCMVSKKNLSCIVTLLSRGAEVNASGPNGETPLMWAVRTGDISIVQALVVFGADLNICNNSGETARHIVATNKKLTNQDQILYILDTVGAKRCRKLHNSHCTDGCAINANYNGIPPENSPLGRIVSIYDNCYRDVLEVALKAKRDKQMNIDFDQQPIDDNSLRILCLDGGGIKGLILVQMLAVLEEMTGQNSFDLFNWIAGTSTGALLAISIALGKTANECRQLYFRMKDKIFFGSRPYDSEPLELFVQKEFGSDTKLIDIPKIKLMLTSTLANRFPADIHLFRNYSSSEQVLRSSEDPSNRPASPENTSDYPLWKVARCSGAAPTYFRPCGPYLDGGLISNNPTLDALTEVSKLNAAYSHIGQPEKSFTIDLIVSCGCGLIPVKTISILDVYRPDNLFAVAKMALLASSLGELLVEQATQADGQVVERAKAWCHGIKVPYFRLNPPISEQISLDEINNIKLLNMLWETTVYMYNRKSELEELICLLR